MDPQAGDLKIGDQVVTFKRNPNGLLGLTELEEQERCEVFFEGLEGEPK